MDELTLLLKTIVKEKNGVEIGGPSGAGPPIYAHAMQMDNIVFSPNTIWCSQTEDYHYFPDKRGKTIFNDGTDIKDVRDNSYDFIFASHCLEHIANPIRALKEWLRIIKTNGHIILILPEKSICFDHKREYSSFETLLSQYHKNVGEDDLSTLPEILQKHDLSKDPPAGTFPQFAQRSLDNLNNRCLHHYVYNPDLLKQISDYMQCEFIFTYTEGINIWFIMKKKVQLDDVVDRLENMELKLLNMMQKINRISENILYEK